MDTNVLHRALPNKYRKQVSEELLDTINTTLADPELYETYRDNFLSYVGVLNEGRFKITDYMNAIKYCTQKLMGKSNIDAYTVVFPNRYSAMLNKQMSSKDIASIISVYNKSKLVNLIMEQSMIPSWILNQDLYQKAINVQAELMITANSEKVRSDAANSLLIHLKPPEVKKVELDVGIKDNKDIANLKQTIAELAAKQKEVIEANIVTVKDVAETKLVTEIVNHDNNALT